MSAIRETLVLGHTRAAADEYVRSLGETATAGYHCLTLTQFAAQLAAPRMAELGLSPSTRLGIEAITARVINRLDRENSLEYFSRVARYPGFPGALASTLTDLRLCGIRPKDGDLRRLLAEYEREMERRGVADLARVFQLALEALPGWRSMPALLLDVQAPTPAHRRMMEAIAGKPAAAAGEKAGALGRAAQYLFSTGRPPSGDYDRSVESFSAPGEGLEAVEMARRIRLLEATPFDRVAILLRSPERYQFLVEEALRRAGIPAYFSRGSARPDPAGRAFLALLYCAAERCSASRFAEYLSLGQVPEKPVEPEWVPPEDDTFFAAGGGAAPAPEQEPAMVATPIAWERLMVDAAVIGGHDRWARRLEGLEREFRLQLSEADDRERIERRLEQLATLQRFALPLIDALDQLPGAADWGVWLDHLRRLAGASLRAPHSVLAALAELEPMSGIGPVDIDEVIQVLSERLRFLRSEPPHRRYGRVFVGSVDEARGRGFDVVFLPGLAEGLFPRRTFEDPLLLDEARRALSPELARREDKSADERDLLKVAVTAARRKLVFSYPTLDVSQGRPRVPSLFALELARAIEGRVPKLEVFERRLSANCEARLGWPAPKNPEHAIDDAEYDLSWHESHKEKGSSRYLIEESPVLARSLRTRFKRWEPKWGHADGLVAPAPAARAHLRASRLAEVAHSPTSLQSFAACPYKFYLHGVYGLRPREEAAALEQMDPLTRGALFHAVQFDFFRAWTRAADGTLQQALDLLDASIARVATEHEEKLAPAIPRVWQSEMEGLKTDLRGWLRLWFEMQRDWEPVHFEFSFGLKGGDPQHDPDSRRDAVALEDGVLAVSYTHLDVYKRQRSD